MSVAIDSPEVLEREDVLPEVPLHPAPWQLQASAYVLAVRVPEDVIDTASFMPPSLAGKRTGQTAYVLFVDSEDIIGSKWRLGVSSRLIISELRHPVSGDIFEALAWQRIGSSSRRFASARPWIRRSSVPPAKSKSSGDSLPLAATHSAYVL